MSLQVKLGKAIQKIRRAHGMSQERLALEASIDRRYMSDIENGKRNLSIDVIERIARAFYMSCSELFNYAEKPIAPQENDSLKKWLCDNDYGDTILLESPTYRCAIEGITDDGRLIYSEKKIIDYMVQEEGLSFEDAYDNFSYNIVRSLPYMGEKAPIIMYDIEE